MNENLEIYNKLSEPPKTALKQIGGGKLKGMTDINPQWRYKAMTDTFGMVGFGWKYTIDKTWLETAANGEVTAFAQVSVFVKQNNEWSDAIIGVGGSKLIAKERDGLATNDEAFKMAVTDAFSTSLKMLGVAAAVYEGRWDGSKYSQPETPNPTETIADSDVTAMINICLDYISAGTLSGDYADKTSGYIKERNGVKLREIINWCKKHQDKIGA